MRATHNNNRPRQTLVPFPWNAADGMTDDGRRTPTTHRARAAAEAIADIAFELDVLVDAIDDTRARFHPPPEAKRPRSKSEHLRALADSGAAFDGCDWGIYEVRVKKNRRGSCFYSAAHAGGVATAQRLVLARAARGRAPLHLRKSSDDVSLAEERAVAIARQLGSR